jgi:hypothetical protein
MYACRTVEERRVECVRTKSVERILRKLKELLRTPFVILFAVLWITSFPITFNSLKFVCINWMLINILIEIKFEFLSFFPTTLPESHTIGTVVYMPRRYLITAINENDLLAQ